MYSAHRRHTLAALLEHETLSTEGLESGITPNGSYSALVRLYPVFHSHTQCHTLQVNTVSSARAHHRAARLIESSRELMTPRADIRDQLGLGMLTNAGSTLTMHLVMTRRLELAPIGKRTDTGSGAMGGVRRRSILLKVPRARTAIMAHRPNWGPVSSPAPHRRRSPVDRGKKVVKRSTVVDANGIPPGAISAPANCHDSPLLVPTLDTARELCAGGATVHLDRGYDSP